MNLAVYGSLGLAVHVLDGLSKARHSVACVVDNSKRVGTKIYDYTVEPVERLKTCNYDKIIIATLDYMDAVDTLLSLNIDYLNIFCDVVWQPFFLQLEPTTKCNLACNNCTRVALPSKRKAVDLTFEQFITIIDKFTDLKRLQLQGLGEPILNKNILQMLKYAKQKAINTSITTNGSLLDEAIDNGIVNYLDKLIVSLDLDANTSYNKKREHNTVQALNRIINGNRTHGLKLVYNFVITGENITQMNDLVTFCTKYKPDELHIQFVENWLIPGQDGFSTMNEYVKKAKEKQGSILQKVSKCKESLTNYGINVTYTAPIERKGKCWWPFFGLFISCDGLVTPCCIRMHPEFFNFGSAYTQDLIDIWFSDQYCEFRKSVVYNYSNNICELCPQ